MMRRGSELRLVAVLALVVLALTGFSTGSHHSSGKSGVSKSGSGKSRSGSHSSSGGGGGGCSSSSQDHDDTDDDTVDYDSSSSGGSAEATSTPGLRDAEAEVTKCVTEAAPYATVEVTNPNSVAGTFAVEIYFYDEAYDTTVDHQSKDVEVPAGGTTTVKFTLPKASLAPKVGHCEVDLYVPPVS